MYIIIENYTISLYMKKKFKFLLLNKYTFKYTFGMFYALNYWNLKYKYFYIYILNYLNLKNIIL